MKNMLFVLALVLLCTACALPQGGAPPGVNTGEFAASPVQLSAVSTPDPSKEAWESVLASYYAAQEEPAFLYIQKNRIQRFMTEHWTPGALLGIQNQQWHFDSFAKYVVLDSAGMVASDDLYTCTFSADNDRHGFIVVKYFGQYPAVQNQGVTETEYLYDLWALSERIAGAMGEAGVGISSATATRGRLGSDEIILFTEREGSRYACNLATFEVVKL